MSLYHVLNTRDFVQHLKGIRFQQDECIILYDAKALFYISANSTCHKHHQKQAAQRQRSPTVGVLPKEYLFFIPRQQL